MPTYQYACTACGHQLEAVQSFADEPLRECPACEGRLRKLFSAVGVVFKGSGFYRTDSRAATTGSGSGSEQGKGAASGTSGEKKGEKKPTGESKASPGGTSAGSAPATSGGSGSSVKAA